jgi:hypothetical protein
MHIGIRRSVCGFHSFTDEKVKVSPSLSSPTDERISRTNARLTPNEYGADDVTGPQEWIAEMSKHACLISIRNGLSHTNAIHQPAGLGTVQDFKELISMNSINFAPHE